VIRDLERLAVDLEAQFPLPPETASIPRTGLFMAVIRSYLPSKRVVQEYAMTVSAWTWLLEEIRKHASRSLVSPGSSVGILAAQSIGEPISQTNLKSFQSAGGFGVPSISRAGVRVGPTTGAVS